MQKAEFLKQVKSLNLKSEDYLSQLELSIEKIGRDQFDIDFFVSSLSENLNICNFIIGIWSLELFKFHPAKKNENSVKFMNEKDKILAVQGLMCIVKSARIEEDDGDSIDIHYRAVNAIYRLMSNEAEKLIMNEIFRSNDQLETIRLLDALGVLVRRQKFLRSETVSALESMFFSNIGEEVKEVIRRVIIEDLLPMHRHSNFLVSQLRIK